MQVGSPQTSATKQGRQQHTDDRNCNCCDPKVNLKLILTGKEDPGLVKGLGSTDTIPGVYILPDMLVLR